MLDILPKPQSFPSERELLFDGFEGRDQARRAVGAVEVPGIEACEILNCSEDLVATDCQEVSVKGDQWAVGEGEACLLLLHSEGSARL